MLGIHMGGLESVLNRPSTSSKPKEAPKAKLVAQLSGSPVAPKMLGLWFETYAWHSYLFTPSRANSKLLSRMTKELD
ncbi:hypothetical protein VNO77_14260 [Canavalia gladiata]|uniref:Uncharacterized protein n=1 Tax=Canavalia gladiata TaxID=3824 RepID=A0AAN9QVC7_CANGL